MTTHHHPAATPAAAETVSIRLPGITIHRPTRRGDGYRVTMGRIQGLGSTLAAAREDLAAQLATTAETLETEPAFARDDDGALIVAIDRPWGIDTFRATDTTARLISTGNRHPHGPAADLAHVHHYTMLPAYTSGRATGAPRPSLYSRAQLAQALAAARVSSEEFTDDTGALDVFAQKALALLDDPGPNAPAPVGK